MTRTTSRTVTRRRTGVVLAVALLAAVALMVGRAGGDPPETAATRVAVAEAWPEVQRSDQPAGLPDGPLFTPLLFLDVTTAVGTAPTPDGADQRLVVRSATGIRELRRVSLERNPQITAITATTDQFVWAESTDQDTPVRLWTAARSGGPPRLLTADTGNAVFFGNEYDLVVADGRVHWAANAEPSTRNPGSDGSSVPSPGTPGPGTPGTGTPNPGAAETSKPSPGAVKTSAPGSGADGTGTADPGTAEVGTEIRSVALTGGAVQKRTERGEWALSAWPWLVEEGGARLRNMATARDTEVAVSGPELVTCDPEYCRGVALGDGDEARIDVFQPDGSARRQVADGTAQAAVADVAILDRFEILTEPRPDSDLTGTAALVVYDLWAGRTIEVAPEAAGVFTRNGLLWWSTGEDDIVWHVLDLRTVPAPPDND
jgi:hypothetical protein